MPTPTAVTTIAAMSEKHWRVIALITCWAFAVNLAVNLLLRADPALHRGWVGVAVQVLAYVGLVLPAALYAPNALRLLQMTPRQGLLGVLLIAGALVYSAAANHLGATALVQLTIKLLATGFGEEFIFRAFLWAELAALGIGVGRFVAMNVALFTFFHVPSLLAGTTSLINVVSVVVLGIVFCLVRLRFRNAGLPALLHAAVDIAGI
jgi:membrane protease YdiL (CAAX protease family)